MVHSESELSKLAKRLLAMSSLGIYVAQSDGHRYINIDIRELSYTHPNVLKHSEFINVVVDEESEVNPIVTLKEYGSFAACLNRIDSFLQPDSLMSIYESLDYNFSQTIIGTDRVE